MAIDIKIVETMPPAAVTEGAASAKPGSLRKRAFNTAFWTVFGQFAMQGIRFVGNVALAWCLGPFARAAYGLMALVNIYINGLSMLTDVGIVPGVVQSKRGDHPAFLNTAWTMQIGRSVAIAALAAVMGMPLAAIYDEPMLVVLMPFAALATMASGLGSTRTMTARRHLAIGRLTLCRIAARSCALLVGVVWALVAPSVWALVAMAVTAAIVMTTLSHTVLPGVRNRIQWDRDAARDLISFGRWVMISSAISFMAMQADRIILGKLLSIEMLGVYSVAFMFARMPRDLLMGISGNVIFPAVSRSVDLPREQLRKKILRHRRPILLAMAVVVAGLIGTGDVFIRILYPESFASGAWILPILAVGLWPKTLEGSIADSLTALRKLQYNTVASFVRLISIAALLPIGFHFYGMGGAVMAVAFGTVPNYVINAYGLHRERLFSISQDLLYTLLMVGMLGLILTVRFSMGYDSPFHGMFDFAAMEAASTQ